MRSLGSCAVSHSPSQLCRRDYTAPQPWGTRDIRQTMQMKGWFVQSIRKFPYSGGFPSTSQASTMSSVSQCLGLQYSSLQQAGQHLSPLYLFVRYSTKSVFDCKVKKKPCIRNKHVRCIFPKATRKCFYQSKLSIHKNYVESLRI